MLYDICIVGAGVTGLSMLLLLQESGADLSKVCCVDPHFDGGDLARKWTTVQSNTPWSKTTTALSEACPSLSIPPLEAKTTSLIEIAHLIRDLATPVLKRIHQVQGIVTKANYSTHPQRWAISIFAASNSMELFSKKLIIAPGAEPKSLDLPIPSIPLEIALDKSRLQHYIKSGEHALVFGTLHSGTIVIRNLVACGARVTAYHNSPEPFYWARDGAYDGIKEEAAHIADDIVRGAIPIELSPVQDTANVVRNSHTAKWVVYAMGFKARDTIQLSVDEIQRLVKSYDGLTGHIRDVPDAWGFGTAYPNLAPDGIHWDVSVAAFLEHMKKQISVILTPR